MWSDAGCFKLNGHTNRLNCVYWQNDNPQLKVEKKVNLSGLSVWCAISSKGIIGPYFFQAPVTGQSYLNMLNDWFLPQIANRLRDGYNLHFQHDGAQSHYSLIVRAWLDDQFPNAWIGRRGWLD